MSPLATDAHFAGHLPELYQALLVPLIFQPYAPRLAQRVAALDPPRVLETAAGTGVLTRALAGALPLTSELVATDLNQPMLDHAMALGTARPVRWQQADAQALPFPDQGFDAVVCQFGLMFLPDRVRALAEARRVLRPGGSLLFSVWDRIEENDFARLVTEALAGVFPADPPGFLARTPHGYADHELIRAELAQAGFTAPPTIEVVAKRSRANSPELPARAYCQGTPLRNEILARSGATLEEATAAATAAIAARFGAGAVDGKVQALLVEVKA